MCPPSSVERGKSSGLTLHVVPRNSGGPLVFPSWNNGNRDPGWGVAEIQKMSPPTTVGDVADMQLCVIKQGSPPVLGNIAFFVTDLLTLARCAVCILNISVGME